MTRIETSGALRPPLLIGWKITDPDDNNMSYLISLAQNFGISFLVLELNKLTSKLDLNNPVIPENYLNSLFLSNNEQIKCLNNFYPLGGSDLALPNEIWSQRIVSYIKTTSLKDLKTQLEWSCYVATRSIIIDLEYIIENIIDIESYNLEGDKVIHNNYMERMVFISQLIYSYLKKPNVSTIWICLNSTKKSWTIWYSVYELCGQNEKLKICLKLIPIQTEIEIWQSEPIKCIILSEDLFKISNQKIDLNETIVNYLLFLMENNIKIIIDSNCNYKYLINEYIKSQFNSGLIKEIDIEMEEINEFKINIQQIVKLLKKIYSKLKPLCIRDVYGKGYEDLLQIPLQPLRDNLDSYTYNEFEKCSFKYNSYGLAFQYFLKYNNNILNENFKNKPKFYKVYIVGAGRGPLIEIIIEIFKSNNIKNYEILALDKNPYTMLTLQDKIIKNKWNNIKLICDDMRIYNQNRIIFKFNNNEYIYIPIIISELLGPFGDNELSPECLYGFEKNFNKNDQIYFIPQSYTSYVIPIHSPQIWNKIKNLGNNQNFHMPYTIHLKSYLNMADKHLECFCFEHKSKYKEKIINTDILERYRKLEFKAKIDGYIHGFGAYFKCILFDDIKISILPNESENIKSWFPMFFPIERPFFVNKSQIITLHIWRKTDDKKVWYEWAFTTPITTVIHNIDGFSYNISKN